MSCNVLILPYHYVFLLASIPAMRKGIGPCATVLLRPTCFVKCIIIVVSILVSVYEQNIDRIIYTGYCNITPHIVHIQLLYIL